MVIGKKIVFLGNSGTGKTNAVRTILGVETSEIHIPTVGVEVNRYDYDNTTYNIWDTAGLNKFEGLRDGYYLNADEFVVFCNANCEKSHKSVRKWIRDIKRQCYNPKIKICVNNFYSDDFRETDTLSRLESEYETIFTNQEHGYDELFY